MYNGAPKAHCYCDLQVLMISDWHQRLVAAGFGSAVYQYYRPQ